MGGLYNAINGFNVGVIFFPPMLGLKLSSIDRFRDCWYDSGSIFILTRTGGGNRSGHQESNSRLQAHPNYVGDEDGRYPEKMDDTYAIFEFSVPEKFKSDLELLLAGRGSEVSAEYRLLLSESPFVGADQVVNDLRPEHFTKPELNINESLKKAFPDNKESPDGGKDV